ncbi:hypothetical protein BKA70DRAFT_1299340 [Coprinopsis sp. MPI-PUGE-AT-0042]|nr:hypothetical protein BKA70DRAFT_1299340 [Coprinopsis sp. MPI-PUGE-AT-0042]
MVQDPPYSTTYSGPTQQVGNGPRPMSAERRIWPIAPNTHIGEDAPAIPGYRSGSFQTLPFFSRNGKTESKPTKLAVSSNIRLCGGQACNALLAENYQHLRCRRCRANNIPRRPELKGILTTAQFAQMREVPRQHFLGAIRPPILPTTLPVPQLLPSPPGPPPSSPFPRSVLQHFRSHPPLPPPEPRLLSERHPLSAPEQDTSKFVAEQPPTPDKNHEEVTEDVDSSTEDLDFMYPESEETEEATPSVEIEEAQPIPPPIPTIAKESLATVHPSHVSGVTLEPSLKRRKISHSADVPPLTLPFKSTTLPSPTVAPHLPLVQKCSSAGCTNVLGMLDSLGPRRCSACILGDWKSKKARAADVATRRRHRTVSWAPDVVDGLRHEENNAAADANREEEHTISPDTIMDGEEKLVESTGLAMNTLSAPAEIRRPTLKIKLNFSKARPGTTSMSGWDSDLSDLSDSDMGDSSDESDARGSSGSATVKGESDSEEEIPLALVTQRRASGLKIRIPAASSRLTTSESSPLPSLPIDALRPPSLEAAKILADGGRWCANYTKCRQVLHREYQWKSCVLCRAKTRQYQRQRQNLQTSHKHLEEELATFTALRVVSATGGPTSTADDTTSDSTGPASTSPGARGSSGSPALASSSTSMEPPSPPFKDLKAADSLPRVLSQLGNEPVRTVPGARLCSAKQCHHMLPSEEEYHRRMCFQCQTRCKDSRTRARQLRKGTAIESIPFDFSPWVPCLEDDKKLASGRCKSIDCGMVVHPKTPFAYCQQCRVRASRAIKRGMKRDGKSNKDVRDIMQEINSLEAKRQLGMPVSRLSICIPSLKRGQAKPKPRPEAPYPEYKCLAALLENMRRLSCDFFDAQVWHYASKCQAALEEKEQCDAEDGDASAEDKSALDSKPSPALSSSLFCFDGEFSTVAPDFDIASRRAEVDEIEGANIKFGPKRWVSIFDYGISTRFVCARECRLLEPPEVPGSKPKVVTKLMQGELEVAVVMDRTHPFIPGERTVVRLRLIG